MGLAPTLRALMIGLLGDAVLALTCSAYNDGKVRTSQNLLESLCARDTLSLAKPLPIFIQLITKLVRYE